GAGALGGVDVFIMADTANNQVIIKAPKAQQEEFAKLILKLDQRRPQVQIEVQIVSVTANDDFRLAFETQLIAGQFGLNTNFGLDEEAGTVVTVTPSISEAGYMRLNYDIELSNFVGTGNAATGSPPPKQVRHITSESVTIPGDTTIVVGGIKVDSRTTEIH